MEVLRSETSDEKIERHRKELFKGMRYLSHVFFITNGAYEMESSNLTKLSHNPLGCRK